MTRRALRVSVSVRAYFVLKCSCFGFLTKLPRGIVVNKDPIVTSQLVVVPYVPIC